MSGVRPVVAIQKIQTGGSASSRKQRSSAKQTQEVDQEQTRSESFASSDVAKTAFAENLREGSIESITLADVEELCAVLRKTEVDGAGGDGTASRSLAQVLDTLDLTENINIDQLPKKLSTLQVTNDFQKLHSGNLWKLDCGREHDKMSCQRWNRWRRRCLLLTQVDDSVCLHCHSGKSDASMEVLAILLSPEQQKSAQVLEMDPILMETPSENDMLEMCRSLHEYELAIGNPSSGVAEAHLTGNSPQEYVKEIPDTLFPFRVSWEAPAGLRHVVLAAQSEAQQTAWVNGIRRAKNGQPQAAADSISWSSFKNFMVELLGMTNSEMDALHGRAEVVDGRITPGALHRSLSGQAVLSLLKQVRCDFSMKQARRKGTRESLEEGVIDRDLFVDRVVWRVSRDDAFSTLPVTLVYMLVFMFLVMYHLQIWNRQELEKGLEQWITASGKDQDGPFLLDVNDAKSFFDWMEVSGAPAIFGVERVMANTASRHKQLRVGSTSYLVGDALITQMQHPDGKKSQSWLMSAGAGQSILDTYPNNTKVSLMAALAQVKRLGETSWFGDDTSDLTCTFATYSERARMYAYTEINIPLSDHGHVKPRVVATAILIHPYPQKWVLALDAIYILLIFNAMYHETKDMCASARLGFGEFLDYWGLWNIVDWVSITMGLANICLWVACILSMSDKALHSLVTEDGNLHRGSVMLTPAQTEEILDALKTISWLVFALHITIAVNTCSIVAKFFKAFQANPRLQVVTRTLTTAAEDILHFFVVFGTIFLSFAIIGHVLFGSDLVQFYTIGSSINTGVTVLMGDFGWYADLADSHDLLPSGTPRILLTAWFIVYMFFVLLVLLNMLLAVILERYTEVNSNIKGAKDAPTLWRQSARYYQRMQETKSFVPLYLIGKELENDQVPAHPEMTVTADSLLEAFPKMKREQADWLMTWLRSEKKYKLEEEQEDETTVRMKRTERFVQRIAEELHIITLGISDCGTRISDIESKLSGAVPQNSDDSKLNMAAFRAHAQKAPTASNNANI